MPEPFDPLTITSNFDTDGRYISAERFGNGHINDTFLVREDDGATAPGIVLQRINKQVFSDPEALMDNISRVTEHLRNKNAKCLNLVPTTDGKCFYKSPDEEYWRAYKFVPGAVTYERAQNTKQATDAAAMFGRFQALLADLPGPRLNETIPDFHNTPVRYSHFHSAVSEDGFGRTRRCRKEIEQALTWEDEAGQLVSLLETGQIPERIIHNDTKLDNLLVMESTGDPLCVIDLDTVMPGISLYDFGDMVRTATSPTDEDTSDLSNVGLRLPYYEALVDGFVGATSEFLTDIEIEHLSVSGKIITIEIGLRFLTDYLCGDEYFGSHRPAQNLDRARAQFALAASMESQFSEMQNVVNRVASRQK
jgi:Ser/Thr protein kinase RdoA (MazF antagonist)